MSILELPKDIVILLVTKYIDPKTAGDCLYLCKKFYHYLYDYRKDLLYGMAIAIKCYNNNYFTTKQLTYKNNTYLYDKKETLDNYVQCSKCNDIITRKNFKRHKDKHCKNSKPIEGFNCHKCWEPMFPIHYSKHDCLLRITTCAEEKIHTLNLCKELCSPTHLKLIIDTNPTCTYKDISIKVDTHLSGTLRVNKYFIDISDKIYGPLNNTCLMNKCCNCDNLIKLNIMMYIEKCPQCE